MQVWIGMDKLKVKENERQWQEEECQCYDLYWQKEEHWLTIGMDTGEYMDMKMEVADSENVNGQ